jgi:RNA polymerase sigma-70 factor (ECF subfamily)
VSDTNFDGEAVASSIARALERWPHLCVDVQGFSAHVARLHGRVDLTAYGEELYLAWACARGNPVALRVFDSEYIVQLTSAWNHSGRDVAFADDARQQFRQRMLVPPEPRIATYAATGPLLAWVRMAAKRIALNMRRSTARKSEDLLAEHLVQDCRAEVTELPRYIVVISGAIRHVFAQLEAPDRNLFRLHYLDGVTLEQLGTLHGVHRATVARRLQHLKKAIFVRVEHEVRRELKLTASDFRSVLTTVRSQLGDGFSGLFEEPHAVV